MKKSVPKNLAKYTGKHVCWSLFFNKVAGLKPTVSGMGTCHRKFPEITEQMFFRNSYIRTSFQLKFMHKD